MPRTATPRKRRPRVTFAVARRIALALPDVLEGTSYRTPAFRIGKCSFFRLRDDGDSLAVKIDFDTREAPLQANPRAFFITDHYRGWPAMCVRLSTVGREKGLLTSSKLVFVSPGGPRAPKERLIWTNLRGFSVIGLFSSRFARPLPDSL